MLTPEELQQLRQGVPPGLYKHFQGHVYEVIGVGLHADTHESLVIYRSPGQTDFWLRPKDNFLARIERKGYQGPRFAYLGPLPAPVEEKPQ